jgi:hypothetical protein
MVLGPSNIIQVNSGNNSATETPTQTLTLPSATSGNTVVVGLAMNMAITAAPSGFVVEIQAAIGGAINNYIYRKQVSAGETSWDFTTNSGSQCAWWALEISELAPAPLLTIGTDSDLLGTVAVLPPSEEVVQSDILVLASVQGASSAGPGTAITFSGWTAGYTALAAAGTTSAGSNQQSIASAYLFPGLPGGFGTTVTASTTASMSFTSVTYLGANIQLPLVGYTRRVGGQ